MSTDRVAVWRHNVSHALRFPLSPTSRPVELIAFTAADALVLESHLS
eukprot:SAG31_NODE_3045_length_4750_cov_60.706945_2_plen_47_part_00